MYLWWCRWLLLGLLPVRRRVDVVPLPVAEVDLRIVHHVPLPVHHVGPSSMFSMIFATPSMPVPSSHRGRFRPAEQHRTSTDLEGPLQSDRVADVARIALATGVLDITTDGVEFAASASTSASVRCAYSLMSVIATALPYRKLRHRRLTTDHCVTRHSRLHPAGTPPPTTAPRLCARSAETVRGARRCARRPAAPRRSGTPSRRTCAPTTSRARRRRCA